jgi:hypothetical protein
MDKGISPPLHPPVCWQKRLGMEQGIFIVKRDNLKRTDSSVRSFFNQSRISRIKLSFRIFRFWSKTIMIGQFSLFFRSLASSPETQNEIYF